MKFPLFEEVKDTGSGGGTTDDSGLDAGLDATVDSLAQDLGLKDASSASPASPSSTDKEPAAKPAAGDTKGAVQALEVPKSWPKEMHEHWPKTDRKVQEYWAAREKAWLDGTEGYKADTSYAKALRDTITPYQPLLDAQGIKDHGTAVRYLLNAHYKLSHGEPAARAAFFAQVAKSYGIDLGEVSKIIPDENTDPALKALNARLDKFEFSATQRQEREAADLQVRTANEVNTFASDPAHPYFDEVATDVAVLLKGDDRMSLKDAYEKAVWANPVTREKELARVQKERDDAARKKAKDEAERAAKARGTRIEGKDTGKEAPTGPLGDIEATLRETYKEIQARQ